MSEQEAATPTYGLAPKDMKHFILRRIHSLTGVLPVGAFLVEHIYSNYQAVGPGGAARFDKVVEDLQTNPVVIWLEIFAIAVPLLFHALYGIFVARQAKVNAGQYSYAANWRFVVQRATGMLLFIYIAYHVWMTRLRPELAPELFETTGGLVGYGYMTGYLNELILGIPVWVFYALGTLFAVFHFANGLWGFLIHWGVTVGPKAQRLSAFACAGVGILLLAAGLNSLYAFVVPASAGFALP